MYILNISIEGEQTGVDPVILLGTVVKTMPEDIRLLTTANYGGATKIMNGCCNL